MELHELANLVMKIAKELRENSRVKQAGREWGLTEAELVFQGSSGDYASDVCFKENTDRYNGTLEEAADAFMQVLKAVYGWSSLAQRYNLLEIFVNVRRYAGAVKRYLYTQEPSSRIVPDDPLILF